MNIKLFTIVFFGALGLTIVSSIIGNILETRGILTEEIIGPKGVIAVLSFYFALFCVMVFSVVPLFIRLFIYLQIKIGNGEFILIKFFRKNEKSLVVGFWVFIIIGFVIIFSLVNPSDMFK
jgi:uncharacterized metal-binding protein